MKHATALMVPVRHVWVRSTTGLVMVILAAWSVFTGYSGWQKTVAMTNACSRAPADWPQNHFRYIRFYIDSQRLREPIFDGRYYINLGWDFGRDPLQLRMIKAGSSNYAPTTLRPNFHWDDANLMMQEQPGMAFVSKSNSHYSFPFDSARFDETFTFESPVPLDIKAVLFSNRVAGFYKPCDTITVHTEEGSAKISFELTRNPLIVYTAVLLLMVAALFAVLITLFIESGPLPGALASYFFAVWSIRALFGLTAEGFPTLFDFAIVLLASLLFPCCCFYVCWGYHRPYYQLADMGAIWCESWKAESRCRHQPPRTWAHKESDDACLHCPEDYVTRLLSPVFCMEQRQEDAAQITAGPTASRAQAFVPRKAQKTGRLR